MDTLRDLRALYGPKVDLFFITGADALDKILSWKDADQIFDLAHLVGVTRPGFVLSDAHLPADSVSLVQVPAMAISSTDCRARVASGQGVWYLVPDGVVQYIAKRQLYRCAVMLARFARSARAWVWRRRDRVSRRCPTRPA